MSDPVINKCTNYMTEKILATRPHIHNHSSLVQLGKISPLFVLLLGCNRENLRHVVLKFCYKIMHAAERAECRGIILLLP